MFVCWWWWWWNRDGKWISHVQIFVIFVELGGKCLRFVFVSANNRTKSWTRYIFEWAWAKLYPLFVSRNASTDDSDVDFLHHFCRFLFILLALSCRRQIAEFFVTFLVSGSASGFNFDQLSDSSLINKIFHFIGHNCRATKAFLLMNPIQSSDSCLESFLSLISLFFSSSEFH